MNFFRMVNNQDSGLHADSMLELKTKLIDLIILVGTILGIGTFISSKFPLENFVINPDFFFDIFVITMLITISLLRAKISLEVKTNIVIGLLFLTMMSDFTENGLFTPDPVLIVVIPFLTILVYDLRTTIIVYTISAVSFLVMGFIIVNGYLEPVIQNSYSNSIFRWIEHLLMYSVVAFVITIFLDRFHNTIYALIDDLKKQNEYLAERETTLSTIIENFPRSYVALIDKNHKIISTGGKEFKSAGMDQTEVLGLTIQEALFHLGTTENTESLTEILKQTFDGKENELEISFGDMFMLVKTAPLVSSKGDIRTILIVFENITDRVKAQKLIEENLEEKNVMLQEIHHRVKNNLAVVSGLLEMQSFSVDDPKSKMILNKSINRIISIAKVHEMLYQSDNFNSLPFKKYISQLSNIIISSMNDEGLSIDVDIDISVQNLSINHGVPLGIIFNELITNSVKYGFQKPEENRIEIRINSSEDNIEVVYTDNGIGIDDFEAATRNSLGLSLVTSMLQQIEASFEFDTDNQFKLNFSFPAKTNNKNGLM